MYLCIAINITKNILHVIHQREAPNMWPVTQEKLPLNLNDVFGSKIISM